MESTTRRPRRPFGRLLFDSSGNTLAMMAIAMIPISAMAGSTIDAARFYLVKVRLQQACDAGVLAGRKFMVDGGATLDANSDTQARKFFRNNFTTGWMGTTGVSFVPVKTEDNQVEATARATVPTTLMRMFGYDNVALEATCEARFDVADADIMFVLDTTGSMACVPADPATCTTASQSYMRGDGTTGYFNTEKSGSKIDELRDAVVLFYDTVDQNADPSTNIRYGFVPYTSVVNVGASLPAGSLVTTAAYQSRQPISDANVGSSTTTTNTGVSSASCNAQVGRSLPALTYSTSDRAVVTTFNSWTSASGGTCKLNRQTVQPMWRYAQRNLDVSQFIAGATVQDPTKFQTAPTRWQGCIEERQTTQSATFSRDTLPGDLHPDLLPTSDATRWRPLWPQVVYDRPGSGPPQDTIANNANYGDVTRSSGGFASCGMPALRLGVRSRSDVVNYVNNNDFRPLGGTYHDVGMIWGTRFISPNGLFGSDTAAWPGRNPPNRHIVFMTDGNMAPNSSIYGLYGLEKHDQRVAGAGASAATLTALHNARFVAECDAATSRNITVWMIAFGEGGSLSPEMAQCASPGKAFYVRTGTELQAKFREIATQIAQLRLSK